MCDARLQTSLSRRALMLAGAGVLTAAPLHSMAQVKPVAAANTPDAALNLLLEGNARYVANQPRERDFSAGRASLALGQAPFAAILGCADSRVAPELAFDQRPGDLFVVRVAGNFVTPDGLGSLEFGASVLGTKLIMVLGHSSCGQCDGSGAAEGQRTAGSHRRSRTGDEDRYRAGFEAIRRRFGATGRYRQRPPQRRAVAASKANSGRNGGQA